jgi:triacylglycerol esterase/lipase EstA (alpha/beta hydrolase family)
MLARIVRLSLLLELAAYAALGAGLHARHGWSGPQIAAAAAAFALGIRFALVCLTMTVGGLAASPRAPEHRIGPVATARLVLGEWRTLLFDNFLYLPFERQAMRRDRDPAAPGGIPIILAHGYFSNRGYFRPLVRGLEARGVGPIFAPNFRTVFTPIEKYVEELHGEIERIAAANRHARVILVCHSMGGLAAREYLRRHGSARIARLITIASPHHGTVLAHLGLGANGRQMRRGSGFLSTLAASESESPPPVRATSIYSPHDNLVSPQETSRLAWAKNVALPGLGHIDILGSPRLLALLLDELRQDSAATR